MHTEQGRFLFIRQLSTNQMILLGIAVLLVFAAVLMLIKKLHNMRQEAKFAHDDDKVLASLFPDLQPAIKFTAGAPSMEPIMPSRSVAAPQPAAALPFIAAPTPVATFPDAPAQPVPVSPKPAPAPIATYINPLAAVKPSAPKTPPKASYIEPSPTETYVKPTVQAVADYITPPATPVKPVEPLPIATYIKPPVPPPTVDATPIVSNINPPLREVQPPDAGLPVLPPIPGAPAYKSGANVEEPVANNTSGEINAILNSLSDIIFEYDEHKVCTNLWYNPDQKLVIDLEVFRGKTVTEAMGRENAKLINEALDFVSANGISTTIEFQSYYGSGRWFQSHVSPVFDEKGDFTGHTTSLVTDITAKKKLSDEIKENQQRLLAAQKVARLGDWTYEVSTKQTFWSENLYAILDIEYLPRNSSHFEYYASRVMSEDRRSVYQFFGDMAGAKSKENHHRIITANGTLKYFRIVRGESIRDDNGKIIKITGIIQDVSEYRAIERSIRESRAELAEAQTAAKIGNWKWHAGDGTVAWSDEIYHIYETDKATLKDGLDHVKLMMRYVHPADRMILMSFLKNPANLHRTSYEYRMITPSGRIKYLSLIVAKIKNGEDGTIRSIMGTLQDISARKQAELDIKQTEDNYKLVLETIKLAAISLDRNGNIIFCNKFLAHLLGYQQKNLIGMNWYEQFISENLKPVFAKWYQNNHIESSYVSPVICRDGEERVISWQHTTLYDNDGQIKQTTSIGEDVTDQQKDREQLIAAKEKAERESVCKSEFLSTMSHEIRTPMNSVIGTANLLLDEKPRPDQLAYLNNLKFSGENLLGIIDDILDFNKIEAGKLELSKSQLNIAALANNICQSFQTKAAEKRIKILAEMDGRIPQNLMGDPIRLSQILNNLVSNAIKFTHRGSVTILVREDARTEDKVRLNFTVADTGIGIEPQSIDKIFEPFVQESQNQRQDYGGTGLGLAIIKRLVELHGSEIKVASTPGKGTQFNFVITFDYKAEPVAKPVQNSTQKMQDGDLTGMRVLVVDDNKMNILIASRFLSRWNITVSEAGNGLIATQMVDANDYDLIIMDLQMPIMDGFEATQIIKSKHPEMPVIALTADAMPETFARTRKCGIDDYLTKPFMPEILFEKISKHYKVAVN